MAIAWGRESPEAIINSNMLSKDALSLIPGCIIGMISSIFPGKAPAKAV